MAIEGQNTPDHRIFYIMALSLIWLVHIIMETNRSNDNRPPENNGLNLNDLLGQQQENAPANAQEPINLRSGGIVSEVGNSRPPEMAGILHGLMGTIVTSVMQQLREKLP
ncbi:hypothetical protein LIER_43138 [Lithospermum erythrorhizon]|uniref:Uncharacterized protein n=1 Tax=Lithospermum erythrorhizon TaxID=34254 RepID=A0AAV3PM59_LITER